MRPPPGPTLVALAIAAGAASRKCPASQPGRIGRHRSADPAPPGDRELPLDLALADPVGDVEQVHAAAGVAGDDLEAVADAQLLAAVAMADAVLLAEEVHMQVGPAGHDQPVG